MSAELLNGKALAAELEAEQCQLADRLARDGKTPCLAAVLIGDDPASHVYVRNKARACARIGILSRTVELSGDIAQEAAEEAVARLNDDPGVHGILVQLPLPSHLDMDRILSRIDPAKDVDGFHPYNMGLLAQGRPCVIPCTPRGILLMLRRAGITLDGANAVVIGRSNIVGKPMALLLTQQNCTVTLCHSHTRDLKTIASAADILVAAVGRPGFVTGDMVKPGAAVVDVGINRVEGSLRGDVDFDSAAARAAWLTPVPGGVGPMTVSMLMQNTLEAACRA